MRSYLVRLIWSVPIIGFAIYLAAVPLLPLGGNVPPLLRLYYACLMWPSALIVLWMLTLIWGKDES